MPPVATSRLPRTRPVRFAAPPSAGTPPHGPRRRGPASRLPCATRRRGPPPRLRSGPSFRLRHAGAAPSVTGLHISIADGDALHVHDAAGHDRPQLDRRALSPVATPGSVVTRLAASGGIAPLMPFASLRSSWARPVPLSPPRRALRPSLASALRRAPVSAPLRTPPHGPPAPRFARPPPAPSAPSALHASPRPALVLPMTTPIVDAPTSSVRQSSTPCLAPASRQPLGSSPLATSLLSPTPLFTPASLALASHHHRYRVTPFMFTTLSTITAVSCAVPVTTTSATTPVNVSVMTIMARQLHRRAASRLDCLPSPPCGLARLAAFGDGALVHAVRLMTPVTDTTGSVFASPVRAWPVTGSRTSPSGSANATVSASARASGSVLRTTAVSTVRTVRHSIAVAAPFRDLPPRRFPFAHTQGLPFLTACRGFGFHTPRIDDAGCATDTNGVRYLVPVPPLGVLLLLDRVYALENRAYLIDFISVSRPRFSRDPLGSRENRPDFVRLKGRRAMSATRSARSKPFWVSGVGVIVALVLGFYLAG